MFSAFFIDRPIFAIVVAIVISIAGLVAMVTLPIAQYPQITPVQIQVSATYPGADASTVAQNVGAPIEEQVNGANNMMYMSSVCSSTGNYTLTVYFKIGTDPDLAQVDVQNRVDRAMSQLPQAVKDQGMTIQQKSQTFLMVLAVYSPDDRFSDDYVANYANIYILDTIKRLSGANQSSILGIPDYAMRIWLKPDRMAQLGITTTDIENAVSEQNNQFAVGSIGQPPTPSPVQQMFSVTTTGRMTEPKQFENIILRGSDKGAAIVRLKDVGYVDLGRKNYVMRTNYQGKRATLIAVYQQPGANAIDVSKEVRATLAELSKSFPDGLKYDIALDTTMFVQASIREVTRTFFEAVVLVVLVVFVFLHSFRLTIIPTLAVPVSILGAMIGMTAFGYSINMLTLFGMILAIGLVVDDAIVVVENTDRNLKQLGLSPKEAAKRAMKEVSGPVVAIVLVLNAVFIPVAFLGGVTGQLYKQFAITIAVSVVFSGIVALTLSPALASLLIRARHGRKKGLFHWFDTAFDRVAGGYVSGVKWVMRHWAMGLGAVVAVCLLTAVLFHMWPTAFVPQEDQGYLFVCYYLPDSASLDRTEAVGKKAAEFMRNHPAVANVTQVDGYSLIDSQNRSNVGLLFVALKDYEERESTDMQAPAIIQKAKEAYAKIREGVVIPMNPPSIPGLGITAGFQMWLQQKGSGDYSQLVALSREIVAKGQARKELIGVNTTAGANDRQYFANVDEEKSIILGVPVQDAYKTLQTMFGSLYVSQFPKDSRLWQVILQAEPKYRMTPEDITQFYVRRKTGEMVPLSAIVTGKYVTGPNLVTRFNNYPAVQITGAARPGVSSGESLSAIQDVAEQIMPDGYGFEWSGEAREEVASGSTSAVAMIFGLIFVFLILAAQYESWSLPLGVMLAVPFAILGAIVAIVLRRLPDDIYFQIGLLTLVGLAAKNAILIIEFAVEKHRHEGLSLFDAAAEAAKLRLRPIVMTSFAFILGCVPLAVATGASANSRHSIGTGVIGGTLAATVIAIFFIPMFFWLLGTAGQKFFGKRKSPAPDASAAPTKQEGQ